MSVTLHAPLFSPSCTRRHVQGVSSRVEGVSSRMSLRAKDMLSSVADDHDNNNVSSPPHSNGSAAGAARSNGSISLFNNGNSSSASGILNGIVDEVPAVDEDEVGVFYFSTKC